MEWLVEEFVAFKTLNKSELSTNALPDNVVKEHDDGSVEYQIDAIWYYLQEIRSLLGNKKRFKLIIKITKLILVTPERVFSLVNKNMAEDSDQNRKLFVIASCSQDGQTRIHFKML